VIEIKGEIIFEKWYSSGAGLVPIIYGSEAFPQKRYGWRGRGNVRGKG
jgi:hypothetical protein